MESLSVKIPLPVKCTIEERKGKKHAKLHFACQGRGDHCLYKVILENNLAELFPTKVSPAVRLNILARVGI